MTDITRVFNSVEIPQREDGYINLTKMAQATNTRVQNYTRNHSTEEFLSCLSAVTLISVSSLIYT